MSLRERLISEESNDLGRLVPEAKVDRQNRRGFSDLKFRIHQTLLDRVDLGRLHRLEADQVVEELRLIVEQILNEEDVALSDNERRTLIREIRHEMLGLGPLEPLLADPTISDILVNTHRQVFVERRGRLELTDVTFIDQPHLMKIIDKIVSRVGRRIDESSPMVDARLPDGSRVNVIIPPLAIDGPVMSIRRFSVQPLQMKDLLGLKTMTEPMSRTLHAISAAKLSVIISGGTGSGKTTMLNILSGAIPKDERIVTIEDAAELQLQQPHVVRLETRPPNLEGQGEVNQRALVRNALRMRPDRIILGEVRGSEAFDMLQAMNTGHEGSMATIHANTPRDAIARLENMVGMASISMPMKALRQQIVSAVTVVVQVSRLVDGRRKVMSINEITGMEGDVVTMQEIFGFRQTGMDADGKVEGYFSASGLRPKFAERLKIFGHPLPDEFFDPQVRLS
jgi:pilus assembly protein CpaF